MKYIRHHISSWTNNNDRKVKAKQEEHVTERLYRVNCILKHTDITLFGLVSTYMIFKHRAFKNSDTPRTIQHVSQYVSLFV